MASLVRLGLYAAGAYFVYQATAGKQPLDKAGTATLLATANVARWVVKKVKRTYADNADESALQRVSATDPRTAYSVDRWGGIPMVSRRRATNLTDPMALQEQRLRNLASASRVAPLRPSGDLAG